MMLAALVALGCLIALAYLVIRRVRVDEERTKQETRIMRDIPRPPGSAGV
jgi:hypothetical protein